MTGKPRIAILGGGVGAVTAACYLSAGRWRDRFESITIYQQGWRLGGKGASGRAPGNERIEEHGLHVWFGFYENSFRMLDECHNELDELAERATDPQPRWSPGGLTSVAASFRPVSTVTVTDHDGCDWRIWKADFPEDDDAPWRPRRSTTNVAGYVARTLDLAAAVASSLFGRERADRRGTDLGSPAAELSLAEAQRGAAAALGTIPGVRTLEAAAELTYAASRPASMALLPALDVVLGLTDRVLDAARLRLDDLVARDDEARRAWYLLDLLLAIVRGVVRDGVVEHDDFDLVDDWDFRDWLLYHGAQRESTDSALVRALVYDLTFAYEAGDPARPRYGAGTALRGLARTFFGYRGALMYKMNAGMGDVVFAPLYELLVKRGVDVRFFHRVEAVHVDRGVVTGVDVDVQAELKASVRPEDFLSSFPPHAVEAIVASAYPTWPNRPPGVIAGKSPTASDLLESYWGTTASTKHVHLGKPSGAGTGAARSVAAADTFDLVVFGLPIGSVPYVAPEIVAASSRWYAAVNKVKTVATQALQLWLTAGPDELGPEWGPDAIVSGFVEPFDTWADMRPLTDEEHVAGARTVAYFCNVLPDPALPLQRGDAGWPGAQRKVVEQNARRFVARDLGVLWPGFATPTGPRWDWLVDPSGRTGDERLTAQFYRANVEPSDRYVLSLPGTSRFRIPPDDTGFANLFAVGDWTACKLNAGCVEAAAMSGIRAANAINRRYGGPIVDIVGWDEP